MEHSQLCPLVSRRADISTSSIAHSLGFLNRFQAFLCVFFFCFPFLQGKKFSFKAYFADFLHVFFCSTWNSSLLRCRRGDAHRVFDVAILLFPVGRGRYPIVGHQPDGMVDGVHKDAHIPDHGDAVPPFCGAVEQLFDVPIGLTGVEPPLGNVDKRLASAVLRQTQHGPRVTLGEVVVQHELALVPP